MRAQTRLSICLDRLPPSTTQLTMTAVLLHIIVLFLFIVTPSLPFSTCSSFWSRTMPVSDPSVLHAHPNPPYIA